MGMQSQNNAWLHNLLYWAHISPTTTSTTSNNEERKRVRENGSGGKEKKYTNGDLEQLLSRK